MPPSERLPCFPAVVGARSKQPFVSLQPLALHHSLGQVLIEDPKWIQVCSKYVHAFIKYKLVEYLIWYTNNQAHILMTL